MRLLFAVVGLLLGVAAAAIGIFWPSKSLLIVILSLAALVSLSVFFLFYLEAFKSFSRKRSAQMGLNSVLMVVFFIFIAVMVNLIVSQYYFRYDLSSTGRFTLSPQTKNIVSKLDEELTVLAFVQGEGTEYRDTISLLEGYRYLNHRVLYSVYDLDTVPALAQRYGVDDYDTVVVAYRGRFVKVDGINEETITNGIIKVTREKSKAVYFVEGHGERAITDEGRGGLKKAAESLRAMGYEVKTLNMAGVDDIPSDADVLIISGPEISFSKREMEMLNRYAATGRILLMVDLEREHMTGFLLGFGISLYNGLVSDPENKMAGREDTVPLVSSYPPSPVTKGFALTTVYPTVMGISKDVGFTRYYQHIPLVRSSEKSRIELRGNIRIKGPLILAMLVKFRERPGRMIVFCDSDFVTNEYIDISGNGNLFRNAVSYLAGESGLVSISPVKPEFVPLYITDSQARTIMYIFMVGLPAVVSVAGAILWLRRRRL
jgi:ABC-type uncharacterized transport system involved in gliding motility auxiliary subunit